MEIQSYKCPNCGGGLVFDPKTQKFKCEYCLSAFTEETMKEMEEAKLIMEGLRDVEQGRTVDGETFMKELGTKYGL